MKLEKIDDYRWRLPETSVPGMRVPGIIYADEKLLEDIFRDRALQQVANAANLPGIVKYSLAMPDIHWGYGLPIGGVIATDIEAGGVVTPGGVGYDINCGVRLINTNLTEKEIKPRLKELVAALYNDIPAGVGSKGKIKATGKDETELLVKGAKWAVKRGYGWNEDLEHTEENGEIAGADPDKVSERAYKRGERQAGTLGSGNHFIEVQAVDRVYDEEKARAFDIAPGNVTVMIHSGSRGFGYQICDEHAKGMVRSLAKYNINVPDKQLACVPCHSEEGKSYLAAMRCAANYAWANRQCLMHLVREVFEKVFARSAKNLGMNLLYDVAHNIAKFEKYSIDGKEKLLCVHRKGATRAFPGQPVIIPGDMGSNSFLLVGTQKAEETFYSTCHGAGRVLSRKAAISACRGRSISGELEEKGVLVMAAEKAVLAEEAPEAYKNVSDVVNVVHAAGISRRVARMRPLCVIKG